MNLSKWSALLLIACAAIFGLSIFIGLQTAGILAPVQTLSQAVKLSHPTRDIPPPATPLPQKPVVLRAFGDIMMGRNVEARTDKKGLGYPFERIQELLSGADFLIANLEGPVIAKPIRTPTGSTRFSFGEAIATALRDEGFDLLSIANNHTFDYGEKGLAETRTFLRAHGIEPFGDPNEENAARAAVQQAADRKFYFIGFNGFRSSFDAEQAAAVVQEFAERKDGFIVVMIHWGTEYVLTHNRQQERVAHALIDAGADVIFGHHPHVVQDIEVYEGKAIFYSLGNFIF
ncbi:MAG: CapA family protein, partial [Parcubacteria group bacterium]|nr:CapA family protein [Parcubacteria group bacterium]